MNNGYEYGGHHGPDHVAPMNRPSDRAEIFENALNATDPAPKHYPGIPRQWKVTLSSGQQLLVRFTDESETDIEVAYRGNEWSRWSPATPGVPA